MDYAVSENKTMAEEINARLVGTEFVRHYYTMLNERPDCLHLFFTQNSSYVHGGVEKPGDELPPVRGQAAIRDKIASFQFSDCRTKVRQVDCQETIGNAVLVQVSGELSNGGEPMRRFMQTFVLVPQSPKKFYVHNDIFRYQDEVFADGENLSDDQCEGNDIKIEDVESGANVIAEEVDKNLPPVTSDVQPEIGHVHDQSEQIVIVADPTPATQEVKLQMATVEEAEDVPVKAVVISAAEVPSTSQILKEEEVETKKEPEKDLLPQVVPTQKPFSWASLASKNATPVPPAQVPAPPKPQAAIKPERKTDMAPASAPLQQRAPRTGRPEISLNEADRKWTPIEGDEAPGSKRSSYPDNQQLFVGNLPHVITEKQLQEFFEQFGVVVDVKINRKGPAANLPNFGFVAFENTEAVEKAMKAKPLMLFGKHRINIEEKKDNSELGNRSRVNSRGRGGSGYGRGAYLNRAGRGAGHNVRQMSTGPSGDMEQ